MARESIQEEADGLCTRPLQKGRVLAGRAGETGCSKREQPKRGPETGRTVWERGTKVTGLSEPRGCVGEHGTLNARLRE